MTIRDLAESDLPTAWRAINEPFMEPPFRYRDVYALKSLWYLTLDLPFTTIDSDLLSELSGQGWFDDGLDDLEAALLYAVRLSQENFRRALIGTHFVESRPVAPPITGDVEIIVVRHTPFPPGDHTFDVLEEGIRATEEFFAVPFPVDDVILLISEPELWAVGAKHYEARSGGDGEYYVEAIMLADDSEFGPSRASIYHEIAHYWLCA